MGNLEGVVVGDTLILSGSNMRGRRTEVTVTRVGRKYVYVGRSRYRMDTGTEADGYGHTSLRTPAQAAEAYRRTEMLAELEERGLVPVRYARCGLSMAQLERVLEVLREPAQDDGE